MGSRCADDCSRSIGGRTRSILPRIDSKINPMKREEISNELARLLANQTEFFTKGTEHTFSELQEFEQSRERVRQLFAEWRDQGRRNDLSN
jgi:hypothetical protein